LPTLIVAVIGFSLEVAPAVCAEAFDAFQAQSRKKVVPIDTVEVAAQHAAALEICVLIGTGTGRCDRASREALCRRAL